MRELAGPRTEVVDLAGRMLVPGFQDAHVHPVGGGVDMLQCDLHDLSTAEEYLRAIGEYAESHPDVPWILGGGWSMDAFPGGTPTAAAPRRGRDRPTRLPAEPRRPQRVGELDRAEDRRASRATRPIPPTAGSSATPTGSLPGRCTRGRWTSWAPTRRSPHPRSSYEGLLKGQAYLHSLGITAWQDAIVGTISWANNLETYVKAAEAGDLTARVVGALWWDRHLGLEQIEELEAQRARGRVGRFAATSVKIMQDGVCENFTAAVLEPYLDAHGRRHGEPRHLIRRAGAC